MIPKTYSPTNLRKLMAESDAYKSLEPEEKANIEEHIKQNNKSVLLYIFQQLREEALSHKKSRENLVKNVMTFSEDEMDTLTEDVKNSIRE